MNGTVLIARHEFLTTFRRRSFLLMAFGVPLVVTLIAAGATIVKRNSSDGGEAASGQAYQPAVEGYVDQSGLIQVLPSAIPAGHLLAYAGEAQAQEALALGRIAAYYVIPADYVEKGEIFYVYPDSKPLTADGQDWLVLTALMVNLAGGDEDLAERVWNPMDLEVFDLGAAPQQTAAAPGPWATYFPLLMVVLFFASFMISSTLLSESVVSEKVNCTIEVLMLSVSPVQMLAGKVAGLGMAALIQTAAWLGTVFGVMQRGGQALSLPAESPFPLSLLAWGLLFFLLGFALYASLMAGVGAVASRPKEVSQASYVVLAPLLVGYLVAVFAPAAEAAQGPLPTVLSLFPLTAPVVMVMRLSAGPVPAWQLLLSVGLMGVTACLSLRAIAAMFRAQYLLSGQPFSLTRYLAALFRSDHRGRNFFMG